MPGTSTEQPIYLGKGPEIPFGNRIDQRLFEKMKQVSEEEKIPIQIVAGAGRTGNDSEIIQDTNGGVPCVLISIPLCYMHTPVEVVSLHDVKQGGALAAAFIKSLDKLKWEELLCF